MPEGNENSQNLPLPNTDLKFEAEIQIEEAGFSFCPISGFELELDGAVYMYSEDGNLEISLMGGKLDNEISIAEYNNELAEAFMESFDSFELIEAGTDTIQDVTGFIDNINFSHAGEIGAGKTLICSPHYNQFFFMLIIATKDYWEQKGHKIFDALKEKIHFHPQFTSETEDETEEKHPDLTVETYERLSIEDDFLLNIEESDQSILLTAHTLSPTGSLWLSEVNLQNGKQLYHFDPARDMFKSLMSRSPYRSEHGELCIYWPQDKNRRLEIGTYAFTFDTQDDDLQEIHVIIRSGPIRPQQYLDINIWLASEDPAFEDSDFLDAYDKKIRQAIQPKLAATGLILGQVRYVHPAPDEISTFSHINIQTDFTDCSYMIAESISNGRALNVGLVDSLTQPKDESTEEILSFSTGRPGTILAPESPNACILLNWQALKDKEDRMAELLIMELVRFCGIENQAQHTTPDKMSLAPNTVWALHRHPIFYNPD